MQKYSQHTSFGFELYVRVYMYYKQIPMCQSDFEYAGS